MSTNGRRVTTALLIDEGDPDAAIGVPGHPTLRAAASRPDSWRARGTRPPVAVPRRSRAAERTTRSALVGMSLMILSGLMLGFVLCFTVIGGLHYQRAQSVGYAAFRQELALAEAPVGQLDYDGRPVVPGAPVAVLDIPALHLNVLVRDGTSAGVLADGPGLERDTVLPGQAGVSVVYGRRWTYGGPFGSLGQLRAGDVISVTTGQGTTEYRVIDVRLPGDRVPTGPAKGHGRLILVTAGGSPWLPSTVVRIDADTVSSGKAAGPVVASALLSPSESVLASDGGAWVPILLWSEVLLLVAGVITWLATRWRGPQLWAVAAPVVLLVGVELGNQAARLLPNLM